MKAPKKRPTGKFGQNSVPRRDASKEQAETSKVSKTLGLRKWITVGALTSLVTITTIVSSTKDGFDLARDYIFPDVGRDYRDVSKQSRDGSASPSRSDPTLGFDASESESMPREQPGQELIDLLDHRAQTLLVDVSDPDIRANFLSLHKSNVQAIRQGKMILSHEITQQIHALLYSYHMEKQKKEDSSENMDRLYVEEPGSALRGLIYRMYPLPSGVPSDPYARIFPDPLVQHIYETAVTICFFYPPAKLASKLGVSNDREAIARAYSMGSTEGNATYVGCLEGLAAPGAGQKKQFGR